MCVQTQERFRAWPDSALSCSARRLGAALLQRHRFSSFPSRARSDELPERHILNFSVGVSCLFVSCFFTFFYFLRTGSLIASLFLATCISLALAPQNKEGTHWLSVPADCLPGILGSKNARGLEIGGGGGINCQENTRLCCDSDSINYHYLSVQVCQPSPRFGPA